MSKTCAVEKLVTSTVMKLSYIICFEVMALCIFDVPKLAIAVENLRHC